MLADRPYAPSQLMRDRSSGTKIRVMDRLDELRAFTTKLRGHWRCAAVAAVFGAESQRNRASWACLMVAGVAGFCISLLSPSAALSTDYMVDTPPDITWENFFETRSNDNLVSGLPPNESAIELPSPLNNGPLPLLPPAGMAIDSSEAPPESLPVVALPPSHEQGEPAASESSLSFGPRGFGGMPLGRGMGSGGPGYNVQWMPDQSVGGQPAYLGMVAQDLSLMFPVWKNGPDGIALTTNDRWEAFHTNAILPVSHMPFPQDLWNIRFGALYQHQFDNGWTGGLNFGVGTSGDKPFDSTREMAANAMGFLRLPQGETNAWLLTLNYSTNSQVLYGIPIPGVAYVYAPSDAFQATIGIPFASVNLHPSEHWRYEFTYALLTTVHTRAIYRFSDRIDGYAGFDWSNENYPLADRANEQDRFFYYEKRLSAGVKVKLYKQVALDLSSGYCFDRYYFQGHGFELTGPDRVDVGDGPFLALRLNARF